MLSHVSIGVKNLARAGMFYDAVFQALGYVRIWTSPLGIGYGKPGGNDRLALFDESDSSGRLAAGHLNFRFFKNLPERFDPFQRRAFEAGPTDRVVGN